MILSLLNFIALGLDRFNHRPLHIAMIMPYDSPYLYIENLFFMLGYARSFVLLPSKDQGHQKKRDHTPTLIAF